MGNMGDMGVRGALEDAVGAGLASPVPSRDSRRARRSLNISARCFVFVAKHKSAQSPANI